MATASWERGLSDDAHDPCITLAGECYPHPGRSSSDRQVNTQPNIQIVGEFPNSRICCDRGICTHSDAHGTY